VTLKITHRWKRNRNVLKVDLSDGPTWAYEIWYNNKRKVRTGFDSAELAGEALAAAKKERRLRRAGITRETRIVTLEELNDEYLESLRLRLKLEPQLERRFKRRLRTDTRLLSQLSDSLPTGIRLHQITAADLLTYRKSRVFAGLKPVTVDTEMTRLRAILKHAEDLFPGFHLDLDFPRRLEHRHTGRRRVLSRGELAAIDAIASQPWARRTGTKSALCYEIFVLLRDSGMRIADAIMLSRRAIHLERELRLPHGSIRLNSSKTGEPIIIPVSEHLAKILKHRMESGSEHPFYWGGSVDGQATTVNHWLKAWARQAGCLVDGSGEEVTAHHLRHAFITHALEAGIPMPAVMAMSGHTSKSMVMHYGHATPDQLALAQRVISDWSNTGPLASADEVSDLVTDQTGHNERIDTHRTRRAKGQVDEPAQLIPTARSRRKTS
jgi:integrase